MSMLGQNLIKVPDIEEKAKGACGKAGDAINEAADKAGGALNDAADKLKGEVDNIGSSIKDIFGKRAGPGDAIEDACNKGAGLANEALQKAEDALDKALGSVAKAIGIREYYSLHIGALCWGAYDPHFSDRDARPDIDGCTPKFSAGRTDLSRRLDEELAVGPFEFRLGDLGLVDAIQDALDLIPRTLAAVASVFLAAAVALFAGLLCAVACVALERAPRQQQQQRPQTIARLAGVGFLGVAWAILLAGALVITAAAGEIRDAVNEHGAKVGMSAATSPGLYFLLWASFALATVALGLLLFVCLRNLLRRRRRRHDAAGDGPAGGGGGYVEKDEHFLSSAPDGFHQESLSGGPPPGRRY